MSRGKCYISYIYLIHIIYLCAYLKPIVFLVGELIVSFATMSRFSSATIAEKKPSPRPPYSYVALITMAIRQSADQRLQLSEIYEFIVRHFLFYRHSTTNWRNSVRHNLSLNECFVKISRDQLFASTLVDGQANDRKGHFWALSPGYEDMFERGTTKRRKSTKPVHF